MATSGDTGSAIGEAFKGLDGIKVKKGLPCGSGLGSSAASAASAAFAANYLYGNKI